MARSKTRRLWAVLAGALILAPWTAAEPCLRVDQFVRGAPGLEADQVLKQRLWISPVWLRLDEMPAGGSAYVPRYIMHTDNDPVRVYELKPATRSYREWEELMNLQSDRKVYERDILAWSRELPAAEREAKLAEYYIREGTAGNLKRDIELIEEPAKAVKLGAETYPCRRVVVKENGRLIVDAVVTDQIGRGVDYYRFYRQLGVFSDEVLAELRKISAFPLRATICVVTGKLKGHHDLKIEVTAVADDNLKREAFDVPDGWTKEEEIPLVTQCANRGCEKEIEPRNLPIGGRKFYYLGKWRYFCSPECYREFRRGQGRAGLRDRPLPLPKRGEKSPPAPRKEGGPPAPAEEAGTDR